MGTVDQSRDPLREVDVIVSSARSADTRKYVSISLGGNRYSALLDPGATSSLMHERVAERFRTQMQNCGVFVRSAMCEVSKAIGTLAADLKIEGFQSRVNFRVMSVLDEDVILGMDFCHDFDVDTRWRRGVWRVREGPWRPFLCSDERVKRESCAGITVTNEEQLAEVNRLVEEVLAPQTRLADGLHPMTDLVEHHIRLTDETPIKHKLHRMTEPMLWEARNTVTKWHKEGIIEPSASDFRSAPVLVKKSDGGYRTVG
uniref:Peptidase A2 domain-containing protein n=1 Tax=Trichogramma kaykai TaxID=54128 RepID=A0ABD2VW35_9HYME